MGETAVGRARAEAGGDGPGEAGWARPWSWRELVAALVALRAEVVAGRWAPVVTLDPASSAGELLDDQPADNKPDINPDGADRDGVVGVLRRIDAVTAAALEAASLSARRSLRAGRERSARS